MRELGKRENERDEKRENERAGNVREYGEFFW